MDVDTFTAPIMDQRGSPTPNKALKFHLPIFIGEEPPLSTSHRSPFYGRFKRKMMWNFPTHFSSQLFPQNLLKLYLRKIEGWLGSEKGVKWFESEIELKLFCFASRESFTLLFKRFSEQRNMWRVGKKYDLGRTKFKWKFHSDSERKLLPLSHINRWKSISFWLNVHDNWRCDRFCFSPFSTRFRFELWISLEVLSSPHFHVLGGFHRKWR